MRADTNDRRGLWAALGSVFAAIIASACCWLPLALIAFGASAAGVSATFERFRPLMLSVTAVLLAAGFYLVYSRNPKCAPGQTCEVPNTKLQRLTRGMLWAATIMVVVFAAFPKYVGLLIGGETDLPTHATDAPSITLRIARMTCEACAFHLRKELVKVPGVIGAVVDYDARKATIAVAAGTLPPTEALIRAVESAGYSASSELEP